jgi:penicillin-binding protein 2
MHERLQQGLRYLGVHAGVGLALDPRTGEVLALVSLPTYDNNIFVTPGKSAERGRLVTDSVRKPLFNRAVSGAYNPGSTIKPLVALAALREKVISPSATIYSAGYIDVPNPYVPDKPSRFVEFNMHRYGWVDVRSALAKSSNVYFYTVGGGFGSVQGLGLERLNQYWKKFGLGAKTGIELEPEAAGFLPTAEEKQSRTHQPWRLGDTFNVSIGQGDLLLSPLQLINYIASIANGGTLYRPRLIHEIGGVPAPASPKIFDYTDWKMEVKEVQLGMRDGVEKEYGTSYTLHDLPITVGAKTGSAQTNNNTRTNAFFAGYAPFEDPEIAILILIENAKEGSLNAVPIAKDIFNWYYYNRVLGRDSASSSKSLGI